MLLLHIRVNTVLIFLTTVQYGYIIFSCRVAVGESRGTAEQSHARRGRWHRGGRRRFGEQRHLDAEDALLTLAADRRAPRGRPVQRAAHRLQTAALSASEDCQTGVTEGMTRMGFLAIWANDMNHLL